MKLVMVVRLRRCRISGRPGGQIARGDGQLRWRACSEGYRVGVDLGAVRQQTARRVSPAPLGQPASRATGRAETSFALRWLRGAPRLPELLEEHGERRRQASEFLLERGPGQLVDGGVPSPSPSDGLDRAAARAARRAAQHPA
jgi:hypothetical protein